MEDRDISFGPIYVCLIVNNENKNECFMGALFC